MSGAPFSFRVASRNLPSTVLSFRASERMNGLFEADVKLALTSAEDLSTLLDERASLVLHDAIAGVLAPVRAFHGVISRVRALGDATHDRHAIAVRLVPALWMLRRRRTRRIFQDKTTLEIAAEMLAEWGVPLRVAVQRGLPKRGFCVQYDETDHGFLMRLLAEEGLMTFFDHPVEGEESTLVIADTATDYADILGDPRLVLHRVDGAAALSGRESHVTTFVPELRSRSKRALLCGYDFRRPPLDLRTEIGAAEDRRVVYEHEGSYESDPGQRSASVRLEQHRREASFATGASFCRRLLPGARFVLEDHDRGGTDRQWVVVSVEHEGFAPEAVPAGKTVYRNQLRVAPAEQTVRPERKTPRPRQTSETATVVGAGDSEIWTDPMGRIKVRFHWDLREGADARDDRRSCWIRCAQAWAGAGFGAQFIPRVGMEVVVTFLGGDLDRPLVTGCVYNATHPLPFSPPENQTRSGFRTASTPNATGGNELSFDDKAGGEQLYVHAQKNLDEVVLNNRSSHIRGSRTDDVAGNANESIAGVASLAIGDQRSVTVGGDDIREVRRNAKDLIKGDLSLTTEGETKIATQKGHSTEVRGHYAISVGEPDKPSASDHHVFGTLSMGASERIVVNADEGISLVCGESCIELHKDKIVLKTPTLELQATKAIEASKPGGPSLTLGDDVEILSKKLRIFTESTALELDKEIKAKGDAIKLGYEPSAPEKKAGEDKLETQRFSHKFADYFLKPYAGKKYHLMCEGLRFEGETGDDGKVEADVPKTAKQVVARLWVDEYPTGRQRLYTIDVSKLDPVDAVIGAKQRLKNLGYWTGPIDPSRGPELATAVGEFQDDHHDTHGLEPNGELDGGTAGALEEVHGS
ncbi:MAG: type VI secretion system tip protein TssI/VgrG [Polyangiaceae bacterium]